MKDYYETLNVTRFASSDEIKRSYRRLAILYHPDKNSDPGAAEKIREINEAYAVLSDPQEKSWYDLKLNSPAVVHEPPQRAHRDPAYRRPRPAYTQKPRVNRSVQLMLEYLPKILWLSKAGLAFTFIFFLDNIVPYKTVDTVVAGIYPVMIKRSVAHFEVFLASGHVFKVYPNEVSLIPRQNEAASVQFTRIFSTPVTITDGNGSSVYIAYLYERMIYFPIVLLISSALAVILKKKRPDVSFTLSLFNALLLVLNFVFL